MQRIMASNVKGQDKYLVTVDSRPREWNDNSSEFIADVSKNFTAFGDEMSVMFSVDSHCLFNNVILKTKKKR